MEDCVFCKIINKQIPGDILYEDDEIIAFKDIHPVTPIHILIVPKKHIEKITDLTIDEQVLIGKIFVTINKIAKELEFDEKGFRVITNCGEDGGQIVDHIHFHLLAGKKIGKKICND